MDEVTEAAPPDVMERELQTTAYELFIGGLSLLAILNIILAYFVHTDIVDGVLELIDVFLSLVFFYDFVRRLVVAGPARRQYFWREFGWADLISSIPVAVVKILRVPAVVRASRRLSHQRSVRQLMHDLVDNRAQSVLLLVLFFITLVAEFGGIGIAYTEGLAPNANIRTGSDAVWYILVTITTVGYGDRFPVTETGRLIGILVMLSGVALFAVFTGFLANYFLKPPLLKLRRDLKSQPMQDTRTKLLAVEQLLIEQEKSLAELRERIQDIERSL